MAILLTVCEILLSKEVLPFLCTVFWL